VETETSLTKGESLDGRALLSAINSELRRELLRLLSVKLSSAVDCYIEMAARDKQCSMEMIHHELQILVKVGLVRKFYVPERMAWMYKTVVQSLTINLNSMSARTNLAPPDYLFS
jgi:predicted transcriptional regulator